MIPNTPHTNPKANCIGVDPRYFDFEACYPDALEICEPCPVKVWCLRLVDPANHTYDGVVGGQVWQNGRPVLGQATISDAELLQYMRIANQRLVHTHARTRTQDEIDEVAVTLATQGQIAYTQLNRAERLEAAVRLARMGKPLVEIEATLHVSPKRIKLRLQSTGK